MVAVGLTIAAEAWTAPKPDAESADENEDAFRLGAFATDGPLRVALADGASDALFSREWARALCDAWCAAGEGSLAPAAALPAVADAAAVRWRGDVLGRPLAWHQEARRRRGAAATLLALAVQPDGAWDAAAVGDACLFHRRAKYLLASFPIQRAADFGSAPELVRVREEAVAVGRVQEARGVCVLGDILYLATDALAHWLLQESAGGSPPWSWLDGITGEIDFRTRVAALRSSGRLRPDDTTLVRLLFTEGSA